MASKGGEPFPGRIIGSYREFRGDDGAIESRSLAIASMGKVGGSRFSVSAEAAIELRVTGPALFVARPKISLPDVCLAMLVGNQPRYALADVSGCCEFPYCVITGGAPFVSLG